jgi:hypothetical protein
VSHLSKRRYRKVITNRKKRIEKRLRRKHYCDQENPMMSGSNIHYEVSEKMQALSYGGIGAIHQMVQRIGLADELNDRLNLLKYHLPYHESDHVLNIAYNVLIGGVRLEDIELRRSDEVFLNALGAERIPDPTTAGDFTRRFDSSEIEQLMEAINTIRRRVWKNRGRDLLDEALIDIDGTLAPTFGECKEGMDISYKGIWGYHPLIISLANTREVLYLVNRPGNVVSHQGAAEWIDKAIEVVWNHAKTICLRGDTDFSLTAHFDRWSEKVDFLFGMDAHPKLVERAQMLGESAWEVLERKAKHTVKTQPRQKPENIKEQVVIQRGFKNIRLQSEEVAEFWYRPLKCKKEYRVVVVKKNLSVEKGELVLFDDIRYFFYITTREDLSAAEVVELANGRCDQENVIEQLKNGVNAMRMPVDNLLSNWAYMVMAALAWNLKAWFALMMRYKDRCVQVLKMEFRTFLQSIICVPAQIILQGRKIIYRFLGYTPWLKDFLGAWERIRALEFT